MLAAVGDGCPWVGIQLWPPARELCSLPATQSAGWALVYLDQLHFGSDTSKSHLGAAGSGLPRISLPAPAFYLPCHAQPQFPHQATASLHITRTEWVGHVKTSAFAWLIILNIRNASFPQESESSGLD